MMTFIQPILKRIQKMRATSAAFGALDPKAFADQHAPAYPQRGTIRAPQIVSKRGLRPTWSPQFSTWCARARAIALRVI
jgi:hypothetical protein